MIIKKLLSAATLAGLALMPTIALSAVSEEEARQLGTSLTPIGAEKAGNAAGTIPPWNPNLQPPASYKQGDRYPDPYADEQPLFTITKANMEQHKDNLSPGMQALFNTYPETFRMPVYKSHRDGSYSAYNIEQTRLNATRARLSEDGNSVTGAKGGAPFPIPKTGEEVIWNTTLARGAVTEVRDFTEAVTYRNGSHLVGHVLWDMYSPYHDPKSSIEDLESNKIPFLYTMVHTKAPTRDKGRISVVHEFLNRSEKSRSAWSYSPGVRRVRRAPTISFDTPQGLGGWRTVDESLGFNGSLEKYNWTLVGKQEMYIPYNNYKFENANVELSELLPAGHANPDLMRYELHRVWVVQADLKEGERHIFKKRVLYIDEDSWLTVASDQYDTRGDLWRTQLGLSINAFDIGGVHRRAYFYHDLISHEYFADGLLNYTTPVAYNQEQKSPSYYSSGSLRKLGVR